MIVVVFIICEVVNFYGEENEELEVDVGVCFECIRVLILDEIDENVSECGNFVDKKV